MTRQRLDIYDNFPTGMREYLSTYGWHFSKKMCEWAVSKMKAKDPTTGREKKLDAWKKEEIDELLKKYNIKLENDEGYDLCYLANAAKADFFKSSISDEQHLAIYLKDVSDDADGYDGMIFTRFFADCIGHGTPIPWEDLI